MLVRCPPVHPPAPAGPCAARTHGAQCCPVVLPDLLELTALEAADKDDRARMEAVAAAVESIFSSPGYLLAAFSAQQVQPSGAAQADAGGAQPMDVSPVEQPAVAAGARLDEAQQAGQQGAAEAVPGGAQQQEERPREVGGLDLQRVGATFQSLLKLYDPAVVAAVGNTSVHLLDMLERFLNSLAQQQQDAGGSAAAGQAAAARQDLGWAAPLLFVLLQSPLNSETGSYGSKLLLRIWCAPHGWRVLQLCMAKVQCCWQQF